MADTTPDRSHKDIMGVVIRSTDENAVPRERLLQAMEIIDKTGLGMAKMIINSIDKNEIDRNRLVFQSYDFAAAMSGEYNGVHKHMSDFVDHKVPYVPCQPHRCNIAIEHACNASTIISNMYSILQEVFTFFSSSSKRYQPLLEKMETIENSLHLRNLSLTRWTARAESIQAVNNSFEIIIDVLSEVTISSRYDTKTKTKAFGLRKQLLSFDFIVSLMFMKNIMWKLKLLTEALESPNFNVIDAVTLITTSVKSLQKINCDESNMNNLIRSAIQFSRKLELDPESDFQRHHRRRVLPRRLDDNPESQATFTLESFYRREFKLVINMLISTIESNIKVFVDSVKPLFTIFHFPVQKNVLTVENLTSLIGMIPNKEERPDPYLLQTELENLFDNCVNSTSMDSIINTCRKLKTILPTAFLLCRLCITAGYSIATNERKFSLLNYVKTSLRTTMAENRLDELMIIKSEKDITDRLNISKMVASWAKLKNRRIKVSTDE